MPIFSYLATDDTGKSRQGTLEASDRSGAMSSLAKQGLRPVTVKETKGGGKESSFGKLFGGKVKSEDLVIFTRQLSTMISAGVPLLRSLSSLESHAESPALKKVLGKIMKDIEGGSDFGDALDKHPNVFSDVYVNMVRAGESAGILEDILKRLAVQQEKNASIRKKVKSAMTYPVILFVIMIGAFFGLMVFVIPKIGKIVMDLGGEDAELPALTEFMLGFSDFLVAYGFILIPALIAGVVMLLRYIKKPRGRKIFHTITLKLPGIKGIVVKVAVARFARTFSALMGAGVPVLESLRVTGRAIGNALFEDALIAAGTEVQSGKNLSDVIEQYDNLFPPIVAQMLAVGEETGQTDTVLIKVADFYEEEVDVAIDSISSIIEPVMIVFMGAAVGLIAASVMLPIAGLSQNIQ